MFQAISKSEKKSILKISGSMKIVEEGQVISTSLHPVHRSQFRFALGEGSFTDEHALGEALILDSKQYVSCLKDGKVHTESKEHFTSPFLVGIDSKQQVGALIRYKSSSPISLHALYDKLSKQYSNGFAIVGYALAQDVKCTYLQKPPIFRENITAQHTEYVSQVSTFTNQGISFFGVVIPVGARDSLSKTMVERMFPHRFQKGEEGAFSSRTSVAILGTGSIVLPKEMHQFLEFVKNGSVTSVAHMLPQSILQEGSFAIFPIEDIRSEEKPAEELKHCRETLRYPFSSAPKER